MMIGIEGAGGGRINNAEAAKTTEPKTFLGRQVASGTGQEPKVKSEASQPSLLTRAKSVFSFKIDHESSLSAGVDKNRSYGDRHKSLLSVVQDKYASGPEQMKALKTMSDLALEAECPMDLKEAVVNTLMEQSIKGEGSLYLGRMAFKCGQSTEFADKSRDNLLALCSKKGVDPSSVSELNSLRAAQKLPE